MLFKLYHKLCYTSIRQYNSLGGYHSMLPHRVGIIRLNDNPMCSKEPCTMHFPPGLHEVLKTHTVVTVGVCLHGFHIVTMCKNSYWTMKVSADTAHAHMERMRENERMIEDENGKFFYKAQHNGLTH